MEVGIREGVCNNSPVESTSPENGWRASATFRQVGGHGSRDAGFPVSQGETAAGADLGGSSKYSNENFED